MPESASIADGAAEQAPIEVVDNGNKSLAELMASDKRFSDPNIDWDKVLSKEQETDFDERDVDAEGFAKYDENGNRIDQSGRIIEDDAETKEPEAKVETETKPTVETKPATAELPDDVKATLKEHELFQKIFSENPEQLAEMLIKDMDPRARAKFEARMGITSDDARREEFDFTEYEPATTAEAYILSRKDDVEAIPHVIADMGKLRSEVEQAHVRFGLPIDHANLLAFDLDARLNVIAEHLGLSFPKADLKGMIDALKADGRKTYQTVHEPHAAQYANVGKNAKQRDVERPNDPARTTRETVATKPKPGSSLLELINRDPELRKMSRQFMKES